MEIINLLDNNGHLQDHTLWNKSIANQLASIENTTLTDKHWEIINLVRQIYIETETTPPMRLLIKAIKININTEIATSRYLYQLFPEGPVRLASKFAGIPKPKHCM